MYFLLLLLLIVFVEGLQSLESFNILVSADWLLYLSYLSILLRFYFFLPSKSNGNVRRHILFLEFLVLNLESPLEASCSESKCKPTSKSISMMLEVRHLFCRYHIQWCYAWECENDVNYVLSQVIAVISITNWKVQNFLDNVLFLKFILEANFDVADWY